MSGAFAREALRAARCVVVKIGSALLADRAATGDAFSNFAAQASRLRGTGKDVVVVSSGAIALGLLPLGLSERPKDLASLQAAAAAGQSRLMWRWAEAFAQHNTDVAQVLLTHPDLKDRRRYLNARQALMRLKQAGVVPIVNENDTVSVDEIKLGDNDTLAAAICGLIGADVVVLLTGAAGLFTADPSLDSSAVRVPVVEHLTEQVRALAGSAARFGTGGMITKLDAAAVAQRHGAATVIAPGREPDVLARIFAGDDVGTLITAPAEARGSARKRWIATALRPKGTLYVDAGARAALKKHGSLLPAGVIEVEGAFDIGDAVAIADASDRVVFARGLAQASADIARRIVGKRSHDARALLAGAGLEPPDELVHRDDLVIL